MPAYNAAAWIGEAIESVLRQQYEDWDLVIADDGSEDDTLKIALRYGQRYASRIITVGTHHKGCCSATKLALSYAKGPIITVLDADDWLTSDSLSVAMHHFNKDHDLGYLWTQFARPDGRWGWSSALPADTTLYQALVWKNWWRACAQRFFARRFYDQTKGLNEKWQRAVDFQLAILVASTRCGTMFLPQVTYYYRSHPNQMSQLQKGPQGKDSKEIREWAQKHLG
jgi:glycosyltransferase involved in cell wall biosynthesis